MSTTEKYGENAINQLNVMKNIHGKKRWGDIPEKV
jgi:hypothetical protein